MQKSQTKQNRSKEMRRLVLTRNLIIAVAVVIGTFTVVMSARSLWQISAEQAQYRHACDIIKQASELEPHFAHTDNIYYNSTEKTAELFREIKQESLGWWCGFWGVVLENGEVVLNRYRGSVGFKEGVPVLIQVEPDGCDAMILEGMDLPESWRGHTITVTNEYNGAPVHYVIVSQAHGTYQTEAPAEYYGEMWVWTGEQYEYGLSAVPDYVRRPPTDAGPNASTV